jgi:hypothetical protein
MVFHLKFVSQNAQTLLILNMGCVMTHSSNIYSLIQKLTNAMTKVLL